MRLSQLLKTYAQVPAWNDMSPMLKAAYVLLKTLVATFLVTVFIVFIIYSLWVIADVYNRDQTRIDNCSTLPIELQHEICSSSLRMNIDL